MSFKYALLYLNTQQIECINNSNPIQVYALQMHYEVIFITDLQIPFFLFFFYLFYFVLQITRLIQ